MSEKSLMSSTKARVLSKKRAPEPRPPARHLSSLTLCIHMSDRRAQNFSAEATKITTTIGHEGHEDGLATKVTKISKEENL